MDLDALDKKMLRELVRDARTSHVTLSERVGLSPTACGRRLQQLEKNGIIRRYTAEIDAALLGYTTTVVVQITLERQSEDAFAAFEAAVVRCPEIVVCFLMSGSADYLLQIQARDMEDYERLHKQQLSRLPGVARISSSFAMRTVVKRDIAPAALDL